MTGPVVWQGLDHAALHEAVVNGGLGPAVSMDAEQQWRRMGKLITEIEGRLTAAMRESESEWSGEAAEAARTGISPLGRWAIDAAQDAATTAEAVTAHAYGAATLRSQLRDNPPVPAETIMEALERNATYGPQGATPADLAVVQAEQARRDGAAAKAADDARVYENIGFESRRTLDFWTVPPTVTVEPASAAAPGGTGGFDGSAWAPPAVVSPAGAGELPSSTGPSGAGPSGAGLNGAGLNGAGPNGLGPGGAVPGAAPAGAGAPGAAVPGGVVPLPGGGTGQAGRGPGLEPAARATPGPAPGSPTNRAAPSTPGPYSPGSTTPIGRTAPSPGARGTGPGPWTRAATDPRTPSSPRPVIPGTPPRTPSPGWRSVVPPTEPIPRAPAEPAARPGAGTSGTAGQTSGARSSTSHGMYPPMAGTGGAGQGTERRRPSYLVDDSGAFTDRRWVQPAVITPDDLIPDEHGRLPGQDGGHE